MDDKLLQYQQGNMDHEKALRGRYDHLNPKDESPLIAFQTAVIWGFIATIISTMVFAIINIMFLGENSILVSNYNADAADFKVDGIPWTKVVLWGICGIVTMFGALASKNYRVGFLTKLLAVLLCIAIAFGSTTVLTNSIWPLWWKGHVSSQIANLIDYEITQSKQAPIINPDPEGILPKTKTELDILNDQILRKEQIPQDLMQP